MNSEYLERVRELKFKIEVSLLLAAIILFVVAMFFYSYQGVIAAYPYRSIALAFVGFGSVSMVTASISYSKRSKTILQ